MFYCQICGEEVSKDLGKHLRFIHNIDSKSYYDKWLKKDNEGVCVVCGQPTKYKCITVGYEECCCRECSKQNTNKFQKIRETKKERYGDPNYNNFEKIKQTTLERYGTEYVVQSEAVRQKIKSTWQSKSDEEIQKFSNKKKEEWSKKTDEEKERMVHRVKETKRERYGDPNYNNSEKTKQICLEKYGVDNVFKANEIKEKIKNILIEKYGVEHACQSSKIKQKMIETHKKNHNGQHFSQTNEFKKFIRTIRINKTISSNDDILSAFEENGEILYNYKCPHPECNKCTEKFYTSTAGHKMVRQNQGTELCTKLLPINYDRGTGTSLELFIRSILDDHKINYETNNRKVLSGKELDLYLPDHKLAIECNGVYWHSLKEPKYHFTKWKQCKEQGIQLLTIWEDQIINKPEIIKNIILSKLGIYEHKVGARECTIKEATNGEAQEFLSMYHLQGPVSGSVRLGLYHNDELVSLMVFGRKRTALGNKKHDTWELYRYCTKAGWSVTGGSQKLLSHFIGLHPGTVLESFSSNDISIGTLYKKLGFELEAIQSGSYWYIDKEMNRHHRYSFRKDILVKNGADPNLTEFEITNGMGLFRIYDSGQQKWILNINP